LTNTPIGRSGEKQIKYKDFIKGLFLQPFEKLDHTSPLAYMENLFNIKIKNSQNFPLHKRKKKRKKEKKGVQRLKRRIYNNTTRID